MHSICIAVKPTTASPIKYMLLCNKRLLTECAAADNATTAAAAQQWRWSWALCV